MARGEVEWSFYSYERSIVVFLFFYALYAYGPNRVPRLWQNERGVLVNFTEPEIKIAGVAEPFFFGLATAPAHVEDQLDDAWLDFGRAGNVSAFLNQQRPEVRNLFWTQPEVEIDLAAKTGVQARGDLLVATLLWLYPIETSLVFRMGVDWGRVVPTMPRVNQTANVTDWAALKRYREIAQMVKDRNMKVMMTLFHHSAPKWALENGGWTRPFMIGLFRDFTEVVVQELGDLVDYWIPFNEPTVYITLTHCLGAWPLGFALPGTAQQLYCLQAPYGNYSVAMDHIAMGHKAAFHAIRAKSLAPVGMAHNIAYMSPAGVFDIPLSWLSDRTVTYPFVDSIRSSIDFVGLNYYGQEFFQGSSVGVMREEEYSDSGRAVYPDGLYHMLKAFYKRYRVPIIVTENGVADETDAIRPAYLLEHLLAVGAARAEGVKVAGYIFWTISDNWEWADGFCPKFGLAAVDRSKPDLPRVIRKESFDLFKQIVETREITAGQRLQTWEALKAKADNGTLRYFCRSVESTGMTGFSGLDAPVMKPLVRKDWRFGMWKPPHYTDVASRFLRALGISVCNILAKVAGEEITRDFTVWWAGVREQMNNPQPLPKKGVKQPEATWEESEQARLASQKLGDGAGKKAGQAGADGRLGEGTKKPKPVEADEVDESEFAAEL